MVDENEQSKHQTEPLSTISDSASATAPETYPSSSSHTSTKTSNNNDNKSKDKHNANTNTKTTSTKSDVTNEQQNRHVCLWGDCNQSYNDLDSLVSHLMSEHIRTRQSKYKCEWQGCLRNGIIQPSRFALVSHLRSHTGEKPYYCIIPECSRKFTRSDALAKHMRTVHDANPLHEMELHPWWFHLKDELLKVSHEGKVTHKGEEEDEEEKEEKKDTDEEGNEINDNNDGNKKKRSNNIFNNKSIEFARNSKKRYFEAVDQLDELKFVHDLLFSSAVYDKRQKLGKETGKSNNSANNGTATTSKGATIINGISNGSNIYSNGNDKDGGDGWRREDSEAYRHLIDKLARLNRQLNLNKKKREKAIQKAKKQKSIDEAKKSKQELNKSKEIKEEDNQNHHREMQISSILNTDDNNSDLQQQEKQKSSSSPHIEAKNTAAATEVSKTNSTENTPVAEKPKRLKLSLILQQSNNSSNGEDKEINIINQEVDSDNDDAAYNNDDDDDDDDRRKKSNSNARAENNEDNDDDNEEDEEDDEEAVSILENIGDLSAIDLTFKLTLINDFLSNLQAVQQLLDNLPNDLMKSIYGNFNNMQRKTSNESNNKGENDDDNDDDDDIDNNEDPKETFEKLKRHYLWNLEVNQLLQQELLETMNLQKKLFLQKESLFDANLRLEFSNDLEFQKLV